MFFFWLFRITVFFLHDSTSTEQIIWYSEGVIFLLLIAIFSSQYSGFLTFYWKALFFVGLVSVGFMALQYIGLRIGERPMLPFSDTLYGFPEASRPWTYPFYGNGRILGGFYEPNMSGSMAAFFFSSVFPILLVRTRIRVVSPAWLVIGTVASILAVVGSGSRQAFLVVAIAAAITLFATFKRDSFSVIRAIGLTIFFLVGAITAGMAGLFSAFVTEEGESAMNVFERLISDSGGDITGGRLPFIQEVIASLTPRVILLGVGEGNAILTAHNAYLITLNELGILGLLLLAVITILLLWSTFNAMNTLFKHDLYPFAIAAFCVSLGWVLLIFVNWAQLNQVLSYMFLALPLIVLNAIQFYTKKHYGPSAAAHFHPLPSEPKLRHSIAS
jgi:hypothetical protein